MPTKVRMPPGMRGQKRASGIRSRPPKTQMPRNPRPRQSGIQAPPDSGNCDLEQQPDTDAGHDGAADERTGIAGEEEDDEQAEADDEGRIAADVGHELAGQQAGPDEDEDDAADPAPVATPTRRRWS